MDPKLILQVFYLLGRGAIEEAMRPFQDYIYVNAKQEKSLKLANEAAANTLKSLQEIIKPDVPQTLEELVSDDLTMALALQASAAFTSLYRGKVACETSASTAVASADSSTKEEANEKQSVKASSAEAEAGQHSKLEATPATVSSGDASRSQISSQPRVNEVPSASMGVRQPPSENKTADPALLPQSQGMPQGSTATRQQNDSSANDSKQTVNAQLQQEQEDRAAYVSKETPSKASPSKSLTQMIPRTPEGSSRGSQPMRSPGSTPSSLRSTEKETSASVQSPNISSPSPTSSRSSKTSQEGGDLRVEKGVQCEPEIQPSRGNQILDPTPGKADAELQADWAWYQEASSVVPVGWVLADVEGVLSQHANAQWQKAYRIARPHGSLTQSAAHIIVTDDVEACQEFLEQEDYTDPQNMLDGLILSISYASDRLVEMFLQQKLTQQDDDGKSALMVALQENKNSLARKLLPSQRHLKDKDGSGALEYAAQGDNLEMFNELLAEDWEAAKLELNRLLQHAIRCISTCVFDRLMQGEDTRDLIVVSPKDIELAIEQGHPKKVADLSERIPEYLSEDGQTALQHMLNTFYLSAFPMADPIGRLLADPRQRKSIQISELGLAAFHGDTKRIAALVKAGSPWVCDNTKTNAFLWAVMGGKLRELKQAGRFEVSETDFWNAVMLARETNNIDLLRTLQSISWFVTKTPHYKPSNALNTLTSILLEHQTSHLISQPYERKNTLISAFRLIDCPRDSLIRAEVHKNDVDGVYVKSYYRAFSAGYNQEPEFARRSILYDDVDKKLSMGDDKYLGCALTYVARRSEPDDDLLDSQIAFRRQWWENPLVQKQLDIAISVIKKPNWSKDEQRDIFLRSARAESDANQNVYLEARRARRCLPSERPLICCPTDARKRMRQMQAAFKETRAVTRTSMKRVIRSFAEQ